MRLHSAIYYRSGAEEWDAPWEDRHYRARNLVKALKCKPFNGYSYFSANNGKSYRVDDTPEGQRIALLIASAWVGQNIEQAGYEHAVVVPVPASNHIAPGANFTGGKLAMQIMEDRPAFVAAPMLYFAAEMAPSSGGGGRDSQVIEANLRGGEGLIGAGPVVLLDDVYTTGAHFRAVGRYLSSLHVNVNDGFVMARTVWSEPANMFHCQIEEVPIC